MQGKDSKVLDGGEEVIFFNRKRRKKKQNMFYIFNFSWTNTFRRVTLCSGSCEIFCEHFCEHFFNAENKLYAVYMRQGRCTKIDGSSGSRPDQQRTNRALKASHAQIASIVNQTHAF